MLPDLLTYVVTTLNILTPKWPPQANATDGNIYDYIVVGAGSAGTVVASRLSENQNITVLLVEAGDEPPIESQFPGLSPLIMGDTEYDYAYLCEDDGFTSQALQHPGRVTMNRGKMLGGTSSLNIMFYVRGNPKDYDTWADAGLKEWDWNSVLPYFLKSEGLQDSVTLDNLNYAKYHNSSGPVHVSYQHRGTQAEKNSLRFLQLLENIGIKKNVDYNGPIQFGSSKGYFTYAKEPGHRSSTAQSFLYNNNQDNLFVLKKSYVTKILIDKSNSAKGVEVYTDGKYINVFAKKEVIISAGAINTPKILIASGIGPKEDLNKLNIPVISDLPVGLGLKDHSSITFIFKGKLLQLAQEPLQTSAYNLAVPTSASFYSLETNSSVPDFELVTGYFGDTSPYLLPFLTKLLPYDPVVIAPALTANIGQELFSVQFYLLHPKSSGKVLIEGTGVNDDPKIYLGYFSDKDDMVKVRNGVKKLLQITKPQSLLDDSGLEFLQLELPQCDKYDFLSDDYLDCYIVNMATTDWHPSCTAAMGRVVDEHLKVYGVKKLRVADASVMYSIPSGNLNAPVMMIGEKAADMIKEESETTFT